MDIIVDREEGSPSAELISRFHLEHYQAGLPFFMNYKTKLVIGDKVIYKKGDLHINGTIIESSSDFVRIQWTKKITSWQRKPEHDYLFQRTSFSDPNRMDGIYYCR